MIPCEDENCAFYKEYFGKNYREELYYCGKKKCHINEIIECNELESPETCEYCKHSSITVYETGTIDDIEYRCKLQNNKLIYDDLNPYMTNYLDFPKCNIGKFEKI